MILANGNQRTNVDAINETCLTSTVVVDHKFIVQDSDEDLTFSYHAVHVDLLQCGPLCKC